MHPYERICRGASGSHVACNSPPPAAIHERTPHAPEPTVGGRVSGICTRRHGSSTMAALVKAPSAAAATLTSRIVNGSAGRRRRRLRTRVTAATSGWSSWSRGRGTYTLSGGLCAAGRGCARRVSPMAARMTGVVPPDHGNSTADNRQWNCGTQKVAHSVNGAAHSSRNHRHSNKGGNRSKRLHDTRRNTALASFNKRRNLTLACLKQRFGSIHRRRQSTWYTRCLCATDTDANNIIISILQVLPIVGPAKLNVISVLIFPL